jgi:biotin carboxyl carrier protein
MKYQVRIDHRTFIVDVVDIHTRPVIAIVDGEEFEVWPEGGTISPGVPDNQDADGQRTILADGYTQGSRSVDHTPITSFSTSEVRAPLPGVVISLEVQNGDQVSYSQELCVIESMKMKNSIRASRAGVIKSIHVIPNQNVKHGDILMEFV